MKNSLFFFLILLFLGSCYNDRAGKGIPDIPESTISEEKMADILTDFYLVQANLRYLQERRIPFEDNNPKLHYLIFKSHDVTEEEFEESFNYYKYNLEAYDRIMEKVLENLSKLETEVKESDTAG